MWDNQLCAEAKVVSSSVKAEFHQQDIRQYEDRNWCRMQPQNIKRASYEHCLRQALT